MRQSKRVFLAFADGENAGFFIPVTGTPRLGYYIFDTRKFQKEQGWYRESHFGNRVVEIRE